MWLRSTMSDGAEVSSRAVTQGPFEHVEVVGGLADVLDVPAVRGESAGRVVGERQLGRSVDGDVVVVVDVDEASQPEVPGE